MKDLKFTFTFILISLLISCQDSTGKSEMEEKEDPTEQVDTNFYKGADLSYINEMEDCGAIYYNQDGTAEDPYAIFSKAGCDLVRVRLWHNPDWTAYSNFEDVKKTIRRSKQLGMGILLDFHYSDDWADPQKQHIPKEWVSVGDNLPILGDSLYNYTYHTLNALHNEGLTPEFVQVGNEINIELLQLEGRDYEKINWQRNAFLINKGLTAIRDFSSEHEVQIKSMLHIAQPENAEWWFREASDAGISDFDWIGISYYSKWSDVPMDDVGSAISGLIATYKKPLMVVETSYPYTMENKDAANNILGEDSLIPGYPATKEGQHQYLVDLDKLIREAGGQVLIYWEPAGVSTGCSTRWGVASHWDNATLFDHENKVIQGMSYFND